MLDFGSTGCFACEFSLKHAFQVVFVVLALIAASIHLALSPHSRSSNPTIAHTYLLYLLLLYVGLMGLLTA